MPILLTGLRSLWGSVSGAVGGTLAAFGFGGLIGSVAQKIHGSVGVWAIFFLEVSVILIGATALFSYFGSFANILLNYTSSLGSATDVIAAIGLVLPDNFASCFSIVISVKLFHIGLKLYFIIWNKFFGAGYRSMSG